MGHVFKLKEYIDMFLITTCKFYATEIDTRGVKKKLVSETPM